MRTVKLAKNPVRLRLKGHPEDDRPEYLVAANRFRDALLISPRLYTVAGFGWRVLVVREASNSATPSEEIVDADEVLA